MTRRTRLIILGIMIIIIIIIGLLSDALLARADSVQRGLAMADWSHSEDLQTLNVSWFYGWGEYCAGDARCINMVRSMELPRACYPVLLVGNEPNAKEPWGAPITPTEAAKKVHAIQMQCPATKLIVGNVAADDWSRAGGWGSGYNWLAKFLKEYKRIYHRNYTGGLGLHCYQMQAGWCVQQLKAMRCLYVGEMWLTEYNELSGNLTEFQSLTDYALANFTRTALYTNRQPDAPWALNGASVVRSDGTLDERGAYYASK